MIEIKCINIDETILLIDSLIENELEKLINQNNSIYYNALIYETKIVLINYFTSRGLDKVQKKQTFNIEDILSKIYSLEEKFYFTVEEISIDFIKHFFEEKKNSELTIDETVLEKYYSFTRYNYE